MVTMYNSTWHCDVWTSPGGEDIDSFVLHVPSPMKTPLWKGGLPLLSFSEGEPSENKECGDQSFHNKHPFLRENCKQHKDCKQHLEVVALVLHPPFGKGLCLQASGSTLVTPLKSVEISPQAAVWQWWVPISVYLPIFFYPKETSSCLLGPWGYSGGRFSPALLWSSSQNRTGL